MELDTRLAAKALRAGKPDPGDQARREAAEKAAAAERHLAACELAIEETEREMVGVVDEHRTTWAAQVRAEADADAKAWASAVDALEQAARARAVRTDTLRWLAEWPEGAGPKGALGKVPGLTLPNGEAACLGMLLEACAPSTSARRRGRRSAARRPRRPPAPPGHRLLLVASSCSVGRMIGVPSGACGGPPPSELGASASVGPSCRPGRWRAGSATCAAPTAT